MKNYVNLFFFACSLFVTTIYANDSGRAPETARAQKLEWKLVADEYVFSKNVPILMEAENIFVVPIFDARYFQNGVETPWKNLDRTSTFCLFRAQDLLRDRVIARGEELLLTPDEILSGGREVYFSVSRKESGAYLSSIYCRSPRRFTAGDFRNTHRSNPGTNFFDLKGLLVRITDN